MAPSGQQSMGKRDHRVQHLWPAAQTIPNCEWRFVAQFVHLRLDRPTHSKGPLGETFDLSSARYCIVSLLPELVNYVTVGTDDQPQLPAAYRAREDGHFYGVPEPAGLLPAFKAPSRDLEELPNPLLFVLKAMHNLRIVQNKHPGFAIPSGLQAVYNRLASLEDLIYFRPPGAAISRDFFSVVHVLTPSGAYEWIDRDLDQDDDQVSWSESD